MNPPIITVGVDDPLIRTDFKYYRRIVPDSYTHTISALGGYDTASMTIETDLTGAEDWLEDGLMRHVQVFGSALDPIWEGFIDEVRVRAAVLSQSYGPVLDSANRVAVMYSPINTGAYGDAAGTQVLTTWADDTFPQQGFGILPRVVAGGTMLDADAVNLRNVYLRDNKWPKLSQSYTSQGGRGVTVTLNCKGYWYWLGYPYTDLTVGTRATGGKIQDVLTGTPNAAWLVYDTKNMQTSGATVNRLEDQYRPGTTVIKDAVAVGDGTYRWLFTIYNNLECYYDAAPTDIAYSAYVEERGLILRSATQAAIAPWRMKPGFWVSFDDWLVGRTFPGLTVPGHTLAQDPRLMFVEKVTYRAPFGLQLQGGSTDEIYQVLASYGMGGMG